jgi:hypothetical protein
MVQLAVVGHLRANDFAPEVRDLLEALFNGDQTHMSRALAGEPSGRMASRLNALEGPRPEQELPYELRRQIAELNRQRAEDARIFGPGGELRNPAIDELAASEQARSMREIIEACRP